MQLNRSFIKECITTIAITAIVVILFLAGCRSVNTPPSPAGAIGLQPIGDVDTQQLVFIRNETSRFFGKRVIILPKINMPHTFLNLKKGERYSADSIILFLSQGVNDSISQVVGITGKDIYTTLRDEKGNIRKPRRKYEVWGIMGLGFRPGKTCIVSNFRLKTTDRKKFEHRLRTVVLHEMGHNLGLPHCANARCIMNDANGTIASVDSTLDNYCDSCRMKLQAAH